MTESQRALTLALLLVSTLGALLFWWLDDVRPVFTWTGRGVFTGLAALAVGLIVRTLCRRDLVPDLLREVDPQPFEREGFQFAIVPDVRDGTCHLDVYYQNRFARPCHATVVLKPARGFFLNRPNLAGLSLPIVCSGGGFGVLSVPWAIPADLQGRTLSLEVGAHVHYPSGRGPVLRVREGHTVGSAGAAGRAALTLGAALTGHLHLSRPARLKLALPTGVWEIVPDDAPLVNELLWVPGQPVPPAPQSV